MSSTIKMSKLNMTFETSPNLHYNDEYHVQLLKQPKLYLQFYLTSKCKNTINKNIV